MKIKTLLENTYDLQSIKILSHYNNLLYDGLVKDIQSYDLNNFELIERNKLLNRNFDFITAENNTLTIYTY